MSSWVIPAITSVLSEIAQRSAIDISAARCLHIKNPGVSGARPPRAHENTHKPPYIQSKYATLCSHFKVLQTMLYNQGQWQSKQGQLDFIWSLNVSSRVTAWLHISGNSVDYLNSKFQQSIWITRDSFQLNEPLGTTKLLFPECLLSIILLELRLNLSQRTHSDEAQSHCPVGRAVAFF